MAGRPLVKIAGKALPEPSTYNGNTATIVDSGRNTAGQFIGAVVRDDVGKVEMSWRYLTVKQWADINAIFRISTGGKFVNSVEFFDQARGGWVTRQMYVSDRSAGMWRRNPTSGDVMGWTDCRLSLVEV